MCKSFFGVVKGARKAIEKLWGKGGKNKTTSIASRSRFIYTRPRLIKTDKWKENVVDDDNDLL